MSEQQQRAVIQSLVARVEALEARLLALEAPGAESEAPGVAAIAANSAQRLEAHRDAQRLTRHGRRA